MRQTMLVPLDGSAGSETALFRAAELARGNGATLRLLHVAPSPGPVRAPDGRVLAYADDVAARVAADVRAYLTSAAATVSDVDSELVVGFGDATEEILWQAGKPDVCLIVMATHRRAGFRRLLEGSVAEPIARTAPVPVLLVEHGEQTARDAAAAARPTGHVVDRRFWCAASGRDVEVAFVERGLPGIRWARTVRSCTAFNPPTAVECRHQCVDAAFRRQWTPALPLHSRT
jgi:nucleotide-binding universal stress UspA family protein